MYKNTMSSYTRNVIMVLVLFGIGVIAVALCSHHADDPSWFYYTSLGSSTHNVLGIFGAQCAALVMYLFGNAAWILIIALLYAWYLVALCRIRWYVIDRIIALLCVPLLGAVYWCMHDVPHHQAGGLIGFMLKSMMARLIDDTHLMSSVAVLMLVCAMLAVQPPILALIRLFMYCWSFMPWLGALCSYVVHRIYRLTWRGGYMVEQFFSAIDTIVLDTSHDAPLLVDYNDLVSVQEHGAVQLSDTPTSDVLMRDVDEVVTSSYRLPSASLFAEANERGSKQPNVHNELAARARLLEEKLEHFGINGRVVAMRQGPVVTLYEYQPDIDAKISKILALEDDLALALQALSIRVIAPIPGRSVVGFEVANVQRATVYANTILTTQEFINFSGALPAILGQDSMGDTVIVDIATMPHLLIAGSTGSGKSVALNTLLVSLLCKCTPDELRLILIDPKRLELAVYADIAHLLFPIVTDPMKVPEVLTWVVQEMERRYLLIAREGVRTSNDYNQRVEQNDRLPRMVIIIDELADLMMTVGRDVETLIARIAQMARAAGIHLIVATQRPSVDVITGLIKVNFPSRIAFRVTAKIDSRVILDCAGADKLLGRGDMLFLDAHNACLKRVHGAYVSDQEIHDLVEHIKAERQVEYIILPVMSNMNATDMYGADQQLFSQVLAYLQEVDEVSISLLQRRFRIGYNRSARIIDLLEEQGKIMAIDGSKTRRVIR